MFNKLRARLKAAVEKKAVKVVANKALKYMPKANSSWKTTVTGIITGSIPIVDALIDAYNNGSFTGKSGSTLALGIGIVIIGVLSKDADKTGLPTEAPADNSNKTAI